MKKYLLVVLLLCSIVIPAQAELNRSNFNSFLKDGGAKSIAWFAHPTNTFLRSNWEYKGKYLYMDIYYENGYQTSIRVTISNDWLTSIYVTYDNDDFPPFTAVWLLKTFVAEVVRSSENQEQLSSFESYMQKSFDEMSGKELTCLCMTVMWFDY